LEGDRLISNYIDLNLIVMRTFVYSILFVIFSIVNVNAQSGKALFTGNCKACHSIGGGNIVGPDLAGITEKRDVAWVKSFIRNSQKMIANGDELAIEVFNQFNKIAMPSHDFTDEEMNSLISYMEEASKEASAAKVEAAEPAGATVTQQVATANTAAIDPFIIGILVVLGVIALVLCVITVFLYRLLKS
jgi:mono/diheme cytochrome c family protein